jgi:hypothetical protein
MIGLVDILAADWKSVGKQAAYLADRYGEIGREFHKLASQLPQDGFLSLWFDYGEPRVFVNVGSWMSEKTANEWANTLSQVAPTTLVEEAVDLEDTGCIKLASTPLPYLLTIEKQAVDPYVSKLLQATGFKKGVIPGSPNALAGTLAGGLIGAGAGYGGGWLVEKLLGNRLNLKPRLALLGGALGAAPGLALMGTNVSQGLPYDSGELLEGKRYTAPRPAAVKEVHLEDFMGKESGYNRDFSFDAQEFNDVIWDDPRVAQQLPAPTRAAASGLVTGAAHTGQRTRLVSPLDIARVAAGMGSGYASGAIVGKALGALMGLPRGAQDRLKTTGMWAGVVANVVPLAFGPRN